MKKLAEDLYQLSGFPPNAINVWIAGDVLIDAASRHAKRRILRQLKGRTVTAHALTHVHPDHQGSSHAICTELGIPLWCGEGDVPAMETKGGIRAAQPMKPINRFMDTIFTGPPHPVDRPLREGDQVGSFTVLETPGHSKGHVTFWREADRVMIVGDVMNGMNLITSVPGLRQPPDVFTPDPARNRESIRRLAALEPEVIAFGHGPAIRKDAAAKLAKFAAELPA